MNLGELWRAQSGTLYRVARIDLSERNPDDRVTLKVVELSKNSPLGLVIGSTMTVEPAWFEHGSATLEREK